MKCAECGKNEFLPFTCPYCNESFCLEHRLPENHYCLHTPQRLPLGSALENKDPWSLTKPRRKKTIISPYVSARKHTTNEFASSGDYHFVRNPNYKKSHCKSLAIALTLCLFLVLAVAFVYSSQSTEPKSPSSTPSVTPTQPKINIPQNSDDDIEELIFQLINKDRDSRNLPTLENATDLSTIAQSWSETIAQTRNLTHGNFTSRIQSIGIYTPEYQCGEIIESYGSVEGSSSELARIFVDGWLGSQGHREIMLTAKSGYMGIGVSRLGSTLYGVVDFKFLAD